LTYFRLGHVAFSGITTTFVTTLPLLLYNTTTYTTTLDTMGPIEEQWDASEPLDITSNSWINITKAKQAVKI
jgi:hypothetical protein